MEKNDYATYIVSSDLSDLTSQHRSAHESSILGRLEVYSIYLLILVRYRNRIVSVTKLCDQIFHPNRTLTTVPLILNQINGLMLTTNAFESTRKNTLDHENNSKVCSL